LLHGARAKGVDLVKLDFALAQISAFPRQAKRR
jgi:hypothetical protein